MLQEKSPIKAVLIHIGMNMWEDCQPPECKNGNSYMQERMYHYTLQYDQKCFDMAVEAMIKNNINMVVLDIGDGVEFESHPELAIPGAWSLKKLKKELRKLKNNGIEVIPKLNFSACHDVWMGKYSRMLSTPEYYQCCIDLIDETTELFEQPRFFHIGMDEENFEDQKYYNYQTVRKGELWWDDLNFYFEHVRKNGMRPWMWSDVIRSCDAEQFRLRVSKDVLQSNWYYGEKFENHPIDSLDYIYINVYKLLDEWGYEQVPTASNWHSNKNFSKTCEYCEKNLSANKLLGFMNTTWYPTKSKYSDRIINCIEQFNTASFYQ